MLADLKITNLVYMDIVIPELSVHLQGKGSHSIVNSLAAQSSSTLKDCIQKRWVRVDVIYRNHMPHWPFYSIPKKSLGSAGVLVNTDTSAVSSTADDILIEIRELLKVLIECQISPEVLATHISLQNARLVGLPQPGAVHVSGRIDDAPQFIPSTIMPKQANVSLHSQSSESNKSNMEDTLASLRRLKK